MAKTTHNPAKPQAQTTQAKSKAQVEIVDPRWLLRMFALAVAFAALLGYAAVCLLIYQGSWQFFLHPSPRVETRPHVAFDALRFDAAATGTPRISGWWIPAESTTATVTILYLHGGDGSLAGAVPRLDVLHRANVNIFAFDYRGFGESAGPHPTEWSMGEDAAAALDYLVNTRHLPAARIVPYGEGLGAAIAANLVEAHSELPAVIVDSPEPQAFHDAISSSRARLLPMRALVRERFDVAAALRSLSRPKLLLADGPFGWEPARIQAAQTMFRTMPDPKMTVTFDSPDSGAAYVQTVRRFLDEYVR